MKEEKSVEESSFPWRREKTKKWKKQNSFARGKKEIWDLGRFV